MTKRKVGGELIGEAEGGGWDQKKTSEVGTREEGGQEEGRRGKKVTRSPTGTNGVGKSSLGVRQLVKVGIRVHKIVPGPPGFRYTTLPCWAAWL